MSWDAKTLWRFSLKNFNRANITSIDHWRCSDNELLYNFSALIDFNHVIVKHYQKTVNSSTNLSVPSIPITVDYIHTKKMLFVSVSTFFISPSCRFMMVSLSNAAITSDQVEQNLLRKHRWVHSCFNSTPDADEKKTSGSETKLDSVNSIIPFC